MLILQTFILPSGAQGFVPVQPAPANDTAALTAIQTRVLDKQRIQNLVQEIDPLEQLDEDVEEVSQSVVMN